MTLRKRISDPPPGPIQILGQRVQSLRQQSCSNAQANALLSMAFEELALALEQLQAADQVLQQQHEEWLHKQAAQELECQRYKDLFEHAPAGYLVTSVDGAIRQANAAALALLEASARAIVGRSLATFVPEGQRCAFRAQIAQVLQADTPQEWAATMCSWEGSSIETRLTAGVLHGPSGRPLALYWLIGVVAEPDATP